MKKRGCGCCVTAFLTLCIVVCVAAFIYENTFGKNAPTSIQSTNYSRDTSDDDFTSYSSSESSSKNNENNTAYNSNSNDSEEYMISNNQFNIENILCSDNGEKIFWVYATENQNAVVLAMDETGREYFRLDSSKYAPSSVFKDGIAGVQEITTSELLVFNDSGKNITTKYAVNNEKILYVGEDDLGMTIFTCEEYNTYDNHGFKIKAKNANGNTMFQWDTKNFDNDIYDFCKTQKFYRGNSWYYNAYPYSTVSFEDLKCCFKYVGGCSYRFSSYNSTLWKDDENDHSLNMMNTILNVKTGMSACPNEILRVSKNLENGTNTGKVTDVSAYGNQILLIDGMNELCIDESGKTTHMCTEVGNFNNYEIILSEGLYYFSERGSNGKQCFRDTNGNVITDLKEYNITNNPCYKGSYALIMMENNAGKQFITLFDKSGNRCFEPIEGSSMAVSFMKEVGLCAYIKNNQYNYIDKTGKIIDMPEAFTNPMAVLTARNGCIYSVCNGKLSIKKIAV